VIAEPLCGIADATACGGLGPGASTDPAANHHRAAHRLPHITAPPELTPNPGVAEQSRAAATVKAMVMDRDGWDQSGDVVPKPRRKWWLAVPQPGSRHRSSRARGHLRIASSACLAPGHKVLTFNVSVRVIKESVMSTTWRSIGSRLAAGIAAVAVAAAACGSGDSG
jgi:hypothetical protein